MIQKIGTHRKTIRSVVTLAFALMCLTRFSYAGGDVSHETSFPTLTDEPSAPLPLHDVEGSGGMMVTQSAYIVNPRREGQPVGLPSIGEGFISLGHGQILMPTTVTWSPLSRVELGYGWDWFNLGTFPGAVQKATGVRIQQSVYLNNFNARLQLIKENDFGQKWMPAVTLGVAYKYNSGIAQINQNLGNLLSKIGTGGDQGVDFTLYGAKCLTFIPNHPILLDAGIRETRGQELGLMGFSNKYTPLFEGSAEIFLTKWLILAGEFRAQPNAYTAIPGLINTSGNWTTVDLAWIVNKNLTIGAGYGYFGQVLNSLDNGVWGLTAKYEF